MLLDYYLHKVYVWMPDFEKLLFIESASDGLILIVWKVAPLI